jgi:hypothetical protein
MSDPLAGREPLVISVDRGRLAATFDGSRIFTDRNLESVVDAARRAYRSLPHRTRRRVALVVEPEVIEKLGPDNEKAILAMIERITA